VKVEALRTSFLAAVSEDAERAVSDCRDECRARTLEAKRQADEVVGRARRAGESDSEGDVGQILVSSRRRAHARVLAAQREIYEQFRREALAAAFALQGTPQYGALLERLASSARDRLGDQAELQIDPPEHGGVIGRSGPRRVDYSLAALVDDCIAELGEEVETLWT
jgi:vacuolar-type H+-ATPase subunit E/Vma4